MKYADLLQTIAEVAVAFVGFAGLASVFGRRFSRDEPEVQEERLRGMIHTGLTSVVFGFVPFVVEGFGFLDESTWRVSSALLGTTFFAVLIAMIVRSYRAGLGLGPHPNLAVIVILCSISLVSSQFLNSLGVFGSRGAEVYLLGLLLVLFTTGMFFTRLMRSLSLTQIE